MFSKRFFERYFAVTAHGLAIVTLGVTASVLIGLRDLAFADPKEAILLEMPVYGYVSSRDLSAQAESIVADEIERQLNSDASLVEIKVTVLGRRNGEIIPILSTSVSRTQWQSTPQVNNWTTYYRAHTLFQRHEVRPPQVAVTAPSRRAAPTRDISIQFDRQYDSGRLPGQTVQSYADLVD